MDSQFSTWIISQYFFTLAEFIKPDFPKQHNYASIFFFHNTQLEMHFLEEPIKGHFIGKGK